MRSALPSLLTFALVATVGCAHLAPPSFIELQRPPNELTPSVVETLKAEGYRVSEIRPGRVATGWDLAREGTRTRRERFIVTWEEGAEGPVTLYVRHEAQEMTMGEGGGGRWGRTTHDLGAQQRVLEAVVDRLREERITSDLVSPPRPPTPARGRSPIRVSLSDAP